MNSNLILLPNALSLITYSVSLTIKHSICCIHYAQGKIFWPEVVILVPRRLRQKNPYYKSEASMGFTVRLSQNKSLKKERNLGTTQYPIILCRWRQVGPGSLLISMQPHGAYLCMPVHSHTWTYTCTLTSKTKPKVSLGLSR